jgi:uncharacterized cupredoxin-like copper-binding protein
MIVRPLMVLAVALALSGCAQPAEEGPSPPASNASDDAPADVGTGITPVELAISLVERPAAGVPPSTMGLDPGRLEVREDQRVRLVVTNGGEVPHNLVIEGLDVATETLGAGESTEVEFVAQEKGEYVMYCAVGGDGPTGHRAQGMSGTFVVA